MSQPAYPSPSEGQYPPPSQGYPAPQGGYAPPPGQQPGYAPPPGPPAGYPPPQGVTVVAQPVAVVACQSMRECPVRVSCPSCRADVMTATTFETGTMTWLLVGILCIIGCWPCCLIPFCVEGCKDVIHTCPNCQAQVGVYRRM